MEEWRPISGFEGIYEISNLGRIKRIGPWSDGRMRKPHICKLKEKLVPKGQKTYLSIMLSKDRGRTYHQVHRLVLTAFVGPAPSPKHHANHKNGNTLENTPENLEWVTPSENQFHAYRVLHATTRPGSKHHGAKIREDDALAIRALRKRGWTLKRLAKQFGISEPTVCWIAKGKAWKDI